MITQGLHIKRDLVEIRKLLPRSHTYLGKPPHARAHRQEIVPAKVGSRLHQAFTDVVHPLVHVPEAVSFVGPVDELLEVAADTVYGRNERMGWMSEWLV